MASDSVAAGWHWLCQCGRACSRAFPGPTRRSRTLAEPVPPNRNIPKRSSTRTRDHLVRVSKSRELRHKVQRPTGAGSCTGAAAPMRPAALPPCVPLVSFVRFGPYRTAAHISWIRQRKRRLEIAATWEAADSCASTVAGCRHPCRRPGASVPPAVVQRRWRRFRGGRSTKLKEVLTRNLGA